MTVHALTEVGVVPGQAREALWAAARLGRRLAERPGFQGMRVFRSEMDADSLMVLIEWAEWDAAEQAQAAAPIVPLLERVRANCARWHSRRLESLFDVQFPRRKPSTGMAQALQVGALDPSRVPARQKEFGLRAMTLPGTLGVLGGRCAQDPCFYFCAVEFDSDNALID